MITASARATLRATLACRYARLRASANSGKRSNDMSWTETATRPRRTGRATKFVKWKTSAGPEKRSNAGAPSFVQSFCITAPGSSRNARVSAPGTGSGGALRRKSQKKSRSESSGASAGRRPRASIRV